MRKIILFAIAAASLLSVSAAGKKKVTSKKKATAVKVDTISADEFSYAIGLTNTQGMREYVVGRQGVDTLYWDDFVKGLQVKEMSAADKKIFNYMQGIMIRRQVEQGMIPQVNRLMTGNDSVKALNEELFVKGFLDGASGTNQMTVAEAQAASQKQVEYYTNANLMRDFGAYKKECEDYLAANAKKDSVVSLPSGVQYKILRQGSGPMPTDSSTIKVNYRGTLIDGTEFETTYQRNQPATLRLVQLIPGWREALVKMPIGSKWVIYVPQDKAYGKQAKGRVKPFSTLIFEIELLSIE